MVIIKKENFYEMIFSAEGKEAKKNVLKQISQTAKQLLEQDPVISQTYAGVNEVILNVMYKDGEHQEFETFKNWKEKGYQVKRGSKAFFIWSKPRKAKKEKAEEGKEKDEYKFFGLAYLFSNSQVEKIED